MVTLPNVGSGSNGVFQVRVWDASLANTYEEARATGRKFGKSEVLTQITGDGSGLAPQLIDLQSFSLQTGLPQFNVGTIDFLQTNPDGALVWELHGAAGFRYLIEKNIQNSTWQPFTILTNVTGTVQFTDSAVTNASNALYRARILD